MITVYVITIQDTKYYDEPTVDVFTEKEAAQRYVDEITDLFDKYGIANRMQVWWNETALNVTHRAIIEEVYGENEEEA